MILFLKYVLGVEGSYVIREFMTWLNILKYVNSRWIKYIIWIQGGNFLCISGKQRHRKGIITDGEPVTISAGAS